MLNFCPVHLILQKDFSIGFVGRYWFSTVVYNNTYVCWDLQSNKLISDILG